MIKKICILNLFLLYNLKIQKNINENFEKDILKLIKTHKKSIKIKKKCIKSNHTHNKVISLKN